MEKQLKLIRRFIFIFGAIFFCVGLGIGFQNYSTENTDSGVMPDYTLPIVFMGIGLLDMLIISILSIVANKKAKREKWLFENGQIAKATFVSASENWHYSVNNRHPFEIVCHWQDPITMEQYVFKSKFIWFNPTPFIDQSKSIQVYYNPTNMKSYIVDLSFLPTQA